MTMVVVTVDCYAPAVDDRTRIISVAWVAYGNGYRADLPALSTFCRDRGIRLVVDGIQAVGVIADPIEKLGVDVLVAGGHKAQLSLAGAGFMYVTQEMIELLRPPYAAKYSFASNDRRQPSLELAHDAHRFEYGNPNFLGCWVQRRSARFIRQIGLHNIEARSGRRERSVIDTRPPARRSRIPRPCPPGVGPGTSRFHA